MINLLITGNNIIIHLKVYICIVAYAEIMNSVTPEL